MECRNDFEELFLASLPEDERRQTVDSIAKATAAQLTHLKSVDSHASVPIARPRPSGRERRF